MPQLTLLPAGRSLQVSKGTRLIDAIQRAGLPIARSCGDELVCALCGIRVLEGEVSKESARERKVKVRNRVQKNLRLACALRIYDDLVVTAEYWGSPEDP